MLTRYDWPPKETHVNVQYDFVIFIKHHIKSSLKISVEYLCKITTSSDLIVSKKHWKSISLKEVARLPWKDLSKGKPFLH